ncbi:MAG: NAD(+)/NADH kinase, partial [Candidatus Gastranaerophilaceae bacterium]
SGNYTALNDFVIKGCSCSRTSKFSLKINNKFVCDYIADGIIISTPTGSTAYGLSAGGPILYPNIDCLVIVPICPHTLTARPLVIPSTEKITISSMDELLNVAIDGQEQSEKISEVNIELSPKKAKLAFLGDDDFYSILRNKLHWGISPTD